MPLEPSWRRGRGVPACDPLKLALRTPGDPPPPRPLMPAASRRSQGDKDRLISPTCRGDMVADDKQTARQTKAYPTRSTLSWGKDQLQRPPLRLPDSNGQGWKRPGRQRVSVLEGRGGNVPELPAGDPQGDAPANQARAGASAAVRAPRGARMLGKVKFGADEADKQPS